VRLLANRRLSVDIGWRGPLKEFAEAVDMLEGRRLNGKAVLDFYADDP
jgi:hypothetical protein